MGQDKLILIMGAGTVGIRDADVLLSLGIPLALCKYDAHPDDIKTRELKRLFEYYRDLDVGKKMRLYVARGSRADERARNIETHVGRCDGSIDELDFSDVELVIDATDGMEVRNHNEIYMPNGLPFAVNGGGDNSLVMGRYFASVPNSYVSENWTEFTKGNAKIVSCNTHCITSVLGTVIEALDDPNSFRERIRDVSIVFNRRHDDPHKGRRPPQFVSVKPKRYHVDEVETLIPQSEGLIDTVVSKWPTEYFHNVLITIDFKEPIESSFFEQVRYAFLTYPRMILVDDELSHQRTLQAASWARIDDGDVPFPVVLLHQSGRYKLQVYALTPQRGIVAPSTADYVLIRTGRVSTASSWSDIFAHTNQHARYRGETFIHIKNSIQDNLQKYDEKLAAQQGAKH